VTHVKILFRHFSWAVNKSKTSYSPQFLVFWVETPCSLLAGYQCFEKTCCFHLQSRVSENVVTLYRQITKAQSFRPTRGERGDGVRSGPIEATKSFNESKSGLYKGPAWLLHSSTKLWATRILTSFLRNIDIHLYSVQSVQEVTARL
jgi:hypothetical protein